MGKSNNYDISISVLVDAFKLLSRGIYVQIS